MKKDFYYPSRDGITTIHAVEWVPEGEVKGVLQICHGMVEYIARYAEFAEYLNENGIYVVGNDHLGHGESVISEEYYGFFHEEHGNQYVIGDIHKLRELSMEKYPDVPYFIMGHSMGSFLLRQYLTMYGQGIAGAIIMGTGRQDAPILHAGRLLCRIIAAFKGWKYHSKLLRQMSLGGYNKKFEPSGTGEEWISSDRETREKYVEDPLCSFTFTVNGYYQMFQGMLHLTRKESVEKIPKELPILFTSGAEDPVGDFGRGVKSIYQKYIDAGMKHVQIKLYEGDRHEIINETDRQQVYEDIYQWMQETN